MKIYFIKNSKDIPEDIGNINLVLGLFDGVHIGHQKLINFARENSKNEKLGVLTFDKALKDTNSILTDLKDKEIELSKLPIDYIFVLICDESIRTMSHEVFLEKLLKQFHPKKIFCGPDFKFGYRALGDVDYLKQHFENVLVFDFVKDENGEKISSTLIKELLVDGQIEKANRLLTREYKIKGKIVSGYHTGHVIGFPTANIELTSNYLLPQNGVYFARIKVNGIKYLAVTNIGVHPTINKLNQPIIESHIIDCNFELYGKEVELHIYKKERDEVKFKNINELVKQISLDKEKCYKYFSNLDNCN